jgi:hypothetical protein
MPSKRHAGAGVESEICELSAAETANLAAERHRHHNFMTSVIERDAGE